MKSLQYFSLVLFALSSSWSFEITPSIIPLPPKLLETNSRALPPIIDGEAATVGQFPYQAAVIINYSSGQFFCGGSLINEEWVLTAAHCVDSQSQVQYVALGSVSITGVDSNRQEILPAQVIVHPNYDGFVNNDIALIRLNTPAILGNDVRPVALPEATDALEGGSAVTVSGFGLQSNGQSDWINNILNFVQMFALNERDCNDLFGGVVSSPIVCARGQNRENVCNGDSGGPLVSNQNGDVVQHGIVSFGPGNCESGVASGFVQVSAYRDWIDEIIGA